MKRSTDPETTVQTCIVHLVRHSLNFCGWKDSKEVRTRSGTKARQVQSLKVIYQAVDDEVAAKALNDFEEKWGQKYPSIAPSWRRAWQEVIPFFAFPPDVRKIIYTTNAIESLNRIRRENGPPDPFLFLLIPQNHKNPWQFPDRRSRHQVDLSGHPQF